MKIIIATGLLFFMAIIFLSCKKTNNEINWAEELKGSAWAGEFKYTAGANTYIQPFSIVINNDKTLTWTDIQSTRPGGTWMMDGNKITLKFKSGASLAADVSKDKWSNFNSPAGNGFEIDNLSRSVIPAAAILDNTTWTGQRNSDTSPTENVTIIFTTGNKAQIIVKSSVNNITYQIDGVGIRDNSEGTYFIFLNNTGALKRFGTYGGKYFYYSLKKQ